MRTGILNYTRSHQVEHARTWPPAEEASLRAAFGRTELAKRKSFDEAMTVPALATAIRAMAHALRQTPGELFNEETHE